MTDTIAMNFKDFPEVLKRIEEAAKKQGVPVSVFCRMILMQAFPEQPKQ